PGFKIEQVIKADKDKHGSWISLTKDNKGRLLLGGQSKQPVTRLTLKDGRITKEEQLKLPVSEVMGMLNAFDSLYVSAAGPKRHGMGLGHALVPADPGLSRDQRLRRRLPRRHGQVAGVLP